MSLVIAMQTEYATQEREREKIRKRERAEDIEWRKEVDRRLGDRHRDTARIANESNSLAGKANGKAQDALDDSRSKTLLLGASAFFAFVSAVAAIFAVLTK